VTASGWIYWSTRAATVALIVEDGVVVDGPPYVRRWAIGKDARELWRTGGTARRDARVVPGQWLIWS
jgi:hypothetical protein